MFNINELETKDPTYLSNTRSISILKKCLDSIIEVEKGLEQNMPIDMKKITKEMIEKAGLEMPPAIEIRDKAGLPEYLTTANDIANYIAKQ